MENYEGISVMSTSDECSYQNDISASSNAAVPSSVLGQLTPAIDLDMKPRDSRVFVVTNKSHVDALQVRQFVLFMMRYHLRLYGCISMPLSHTLGKMCSTHTILVTVFFVSLV